MRFSSGNAKTSFSINLDHIYDVLALNNPKCNDYIDVIYPAELEIKDTADAPTGANPGGLIILTVVWSLMRMLNLHMTRCQT